MSLRHLARQVVVQSLFTWDFYNQDADRVDEFLNWNLDRYRDTLVDADFPRTSYEGVIKKVDVIDQIITKAAPQWPIDRIASVDRNILRLGIYEMLFAKSGDVPPRVAINEAIELGKTFGGVNTYKFISGVLGSVYEASDLKKSDTYIPKVEDPDTFPTVAKVGAVVYAEDEKGALLVALVHDIFGKWTLSKGGALEGESEEETCARSVKKEIGIEVEVGKKITRTEYIARHPKMGKIKKQVTYYVCRSDYLPLELEQENDGLNDARWIHLDELENLETYDDIKPIIYEGIRMATQ
ncbi:MAG: transcription antitermination factor NusB [Patescibacteria group bacterium]